MKTIAEAKRFLHENFKVGTQCPVCRQRVRLDPLKLDATMAAMLCRLSWLPEGFHHVSTLIFSPTTGRNFASLKHWGLIAEQPNDDPKKRTSGQWAMTGKGFDFVRGRLGVPRHALLYNRKCWGMSDEKTNIATALGDKFDYQELNRQYNPAYKAIDPPF